MTMDPDGYRETQLADLRGSTIDELCGRAELDPYRQVVITLVEKPRYNIGSGPPGRAD